MALMPPPGLWQDGDRPAASGAIPQLGLLHRPQEHRPCPLPTLQGAQRGPGGENYSEGTQGHSYTAMQFTLQTQYGDLPGEYRPQHGFSGNISWRPTGKKF